MFSTLSGPLRPRAHEFDTPAVRTMAARPDSVTPRKACGWAADNIASTATPREPSVPFLKPTEHRE